MNLKSQTNSMHGGNCYFYQRVLKTRQEIQKFIEHRHNSYVFAKDFDKLRKIETIDVFRDDKF